MVACCLSGCRQTDVMSLGTRHWAGRPASSLSTGTSSGLTSHKPHLCKFPTAEAGAELGMGAPGPRLREHSFSRSCCLPVQRHRIPKLTCVMENIMTPWNRSCAARPDITKNLQIKRYSGKICRGGHSAGCVRALQTDTTETERDTDGSHTDPVDVETQHSLVIRAHKTTHPTSRQGGAP